MREIKFRAWVENEHVQSSVYPFMNYKIVFSGGLVNDIFATSGTQPINTLHNKITYMQYTGLKDKNGVEIYEGDILECISQNGEMLTEVVWDEFGWYEKLIKSPNNHLSNYFPFGSGVEINLFSRVIGNIYKNAELLGDSN